MLQITEIQDLNHDPIVCRSTCNDRLRTADAAGMCNFASTIAGAGPARFRAGIDPLGLIGEIKIALTPREI
jgi:hypothetical protein